MSYKGVSDLFKAAAIHWLDDYAQSVGAALAFFTMFSIAPFLLIVTAVARLFIGATSVFAELQDALDRIWRAPLRINTFGLWTLVRARLLSFGMILGIGFLLMVSLAFSAGEAALSKWWDALFHGWSTVAFIINLAASLILSTAVFAMIYKLMPRVQIDWRDVWIGALVTALLFITGKFLIAQYLGRAGSLLASDRPVRSSWFYYGCTIPLRFSYFVRNSHGRTPPNSARAKDSRQIEPLWNSSACLNGSSHL